jgi:hypothetical protein
MGNRNSSIALIDGKLEPHASLSRQYVILLGACMGAGMRAVSLDDIHQAYEGTHGVGRLRKRAEVQIFSEPFGEPSALRGFDAVVANREGTRFSRALLEPLPDLRIIAQTGWKRPRSVE